MSALVLVYIVDFVLMPRKTLMHGEEKGAEGDEGSWANVSHLENRLRSSDMVVLKT
jgi:hypothetical protein